MSEANLIEIHEKHNPPHFWRRKRPPSALELAASALEECRRELLNQEQIAEYHQAMTTMLRARDARLQKEIERLSAFNKQGEE